MTAEIIDIILMASLFFLLGCILYVGYKLDETNDKLNKLKEFVYKDEEPKSDWMYSIFNEDKIVDQKEKWTKEAEEAGMTLTEYLESTDPLKQEPCGDAISRSETIKYLNINMAWYNEDGEIADSDEKLKAITDLINAVPSVTPQPKAGHWIPVSEKLPRENGWYQCTLIVNDLPGTMKLFYKNGEWIDNQIIDSILDWTKHVVAWMPLPEPYKVESEVEK